MNYSKTGENREESSLSRRGFLLGAATIGASSALLAAGCSPASSEATRSGGEVVSDTTQNVASETIEADFVVVGGGIAGLTAAIYAVQQGCEKVVLLEKNSYLGGSTALAESIFVNGSEYQKENGYDAYDFDEMLDEEIEWSHSILNPVIFGNYMAGAKDYTAWLIDVGVEFEGMVDAGTGRYTAAIYSGGGGEAIKSLEQAALDLEVDIRTDTAATSLIMEGDVVVGVQAIAEGETLDFKTPTVLLASGGCCTDEDMMDEYTRLDSGKWSNVGAVRGQDGDAIKMVEGTIHGRAKHVTPQNMWLLVQGAGLLDEVNSMLGMEGTNLWVNQKAKRWVNEGLVQSFYSVTNAMQNQGAAYSIMDQAHVAQFENLGGTCFWSMWAKFMAPIENAQDLLDTAVEDEAVDIYRADTIAGLAEAVGLDAKSLEETIETWNESVASGVDTEFGKDKNLMTSISEAPFYIAKLTNGILNTMGGIRVDEEAQVITPDGTPIEGLYAAGTVASGIAGEVYGFAAPGSNQGPAVYYGRLAGEIAAARK